MTAHRLVLDPAHTLGPLRTLHGVNNGPANLMGVPPIADRYRELDVPQARLHDTVMTQPGTVDLSCVFPLFHADPDDPSSYRFAATDQYLAAIAAGGSEIVYRLGVSIDHAPEKIHSHPPADPEKWARICVGIVRHVNEGWAGGTRLGVRRWEVWNEPDIGDTMWTGTPGEYQALYAAAARALKAHDPELMVGGPAAAFATGDFAEGFLARCAAEALPLDFYSWHCYHQEPAAVAGTAVMVRAMLDRHGFGGAESHLNEWHYFDGDWARIRTDAACCRETFERINGMPGAAFAAGTLIALQDAPLDMAHYYTGDRHRWGLFDPHGCPRRTWYAFRAFRRLLDAPERVAVARDDAVPSTLHAAAGRRADSAMTALLVNRGLEDVEVELRVNDKLARVTGLALLDEDHDLEALPADGAATVFLPGPSVVVVELG